MLKLFSLFSGIGGPEKALKRLGIQYELVGYSEIDKYASKSYSAVHDEPEIKNYWDITKIDEKRIPDFDLMTWGFPCQDISIAGKQAGVHKGTRSGLYYEGLRILKEKKPKYSIIENVKALVSKKFKDTFESILNDLEEAGYNNYWQVLNAKDYGIPQNRERVFIISIRKDIDQQYEFPKKEPLKIKLKDLLETEVEEKYYLSDRMIKTFSDMTNRNGYIRGKCFKPHNLDDDRLANTIKTTAGSRPEDNYVGKKYNEFIEENGYIPEIFNAYNKTEVKDVAKTITAECGSVTSSASHLIVEGLTDTQKQMITEEGNVKRYIKSEKVDEFNPGDSADLSFPNGYGKGNRVMKESSPTITAATATTIVVKDHRFYEQAYETVENNECQEGDTIDAFNKKVNKTGISPTVTTRPEGFKTAILIPENTKKGYAEAHDGDGVYINRPHQKRGVVQEEKIQTLKTTMDVGVVVENKIIYEEPLEREGWHNKAKEVLSPEGISTCIHTQSNNLLQKIKEPTLRIRKLTPLECWRLMGFDDEDFYKAQSTGVSNTQLYKQAGNSIVVNVLEKILKNLLEEKNGK